MPNHTQAVARTILMRTDPTVPTVCHCGSCQPLLPPKPNAGVMGIATTTSLGTHFPCFCCSQFNISGIWLSKPRSQTSTLAAKDAGKARLGLFLSFLNARQALLPTKIHMIQSSLTQEKGSNARQTPLQRTNNDYIFFFFFETKLPWKKQHTFLIAMNSNIFNLFYVSLKNSDHEQVN